MHVDTPQTQCQAGVAQGDITPPVGIYHRMWGAAVHDRATGVHRPLIATVLWLQPSGQPAHAQVLITLDHCIVDSAEMQSIRGAVAAATGVTPGQVQIALSHTHGSGWMSRARSHFPGGDLIGPYLDSVVATCAKLAAEAQQELRAVSILYGTGRCNLARHRDLWDADRKQFVCGFNPAGPADDTVLVARILTAQRDTLATLVNYACHPTTLAWDNTAISPDYIGAMREVVQQATGGVPCLFLQGASGDLGPQEGFVGDWAVADRNGRILAHAALSALEGLHTPGHRFTYAGAVVSGTNIGTWKHVPLDPVALQAHTRWSVRHLPVELAYRQDLPTRLETEKAQQDWLAEEVRANAAGDAEQARKCRAMVEQKTRQLTRLNAMPEGRVYPYPVTLAVLGQAIWVFAPGELYQVFQVELRRRFAPTPVIVSTVTGDWQPGYLPPASSYGYGIYQDVIAAVAPGSLEVLLETISRELRNLMESAS